MRFAIITPWHTPAETAAPVDAAPRIETRASVRAQRAVDKLTRALGGQPCHFCQSGLYAPVDYCEACGNTGVEGDAYHEGEHRRMRARALTEGISIHAGGPILSVR